jgi:DNA-binding IclR family transcriptional regulator
MAAARAATVGELTKELALTRERGYSIDDESIRQGVYCVAAPVFDASGQPVAGVGVCVHKATLGANRGAAHCDAVRQAARTLSQRLGAALPNLGTPRSRRPAKPSARK